MMPPPMAANIPNFRPARKITGPPIKVATTNPPAMGTWGKVLGSSYFIGHLTPSWLRLILVRLLTACSLVQRLLKDFHASLAVQLLLLSSLTAIIGHLHNLFLLLP